MTTTVPRPSGKLTVRDRLFRLAETVTTPLLPEDYLDLVAPLRSGAALRGRIVDVRPETRDAATVTIRPGRGWRGHTPGQYVRLGVDVDGVRQWRAYSLTSVPGRRDGLISVTVKAIPDGRVSNHLVRRATPGTLVQLDQAQGDFVQPATAPERILFVTAGSGVTPVMGMLRAGATGSADVVLVHSAPTPADVVFADELRGLARQGAIRLVERHTDTDGVLGVAELADLVPDHLDRQTWACGPVGLLDAVEAHWAGHGVADRLHTERFRPTVISPGAGGTVTFTRAGVTVGADGGTALLDVGEDAGVLMPSGCRMGICFGCVVPLRQGAVRDLRNGDVTTAVPGDGVLIQTCVSAAAGTCDIDL
ncbi:Stearoyl-CoA 9-desaturase electron transfer partner [Micromonospora sp. MW-13]|uniref:ferredoxin reductase n=1 Tax=Micromonospora sp. MW-13 TaxID=2094022 RepID=UPI000E43F063|nr:ferredoxin reductase [Micromonospora sp. MW-13]RGC69109.1 Stearoyl-CoA 9-desaturase electron transfer partner [Micromonospora sp. MW-13]